LAFTPKNPQLYCVLKEAVCAIVDEFIREGKDFDSEEFIGHFSYIFVGDRDQIDPDSERRRKILAAGFLPQYAEKTQEALRILRANFSGWTTEGLFCVLVDDFLNSVIPRVGNLPNWEQRFDDFYAAFESDLFADSIGVSTIGVLRNVYDHSGSFRPTGGLSFHWWSKMNTPLRHASLRERVIPFYQMSRFINEEKGCAPFNSSPAFFGFEFKERIPKRRFLATIHDRENEVTRKVVLTMRLLLMAGAYVDYRGSRFAGRLSSLWFHLIDYPEEVIENGDSRDLQSYSGAVERLFPSVLQCPYSRLGARLRIELKGVRA